jgi:hypothetical protein
MAYWIMFVGPDTTAPTLSHTPASFLFTTTSLLRLGFEADDNLGLSNLRTELWLDGQPLDTVDYQPQGETEFFTDISIVDVSAFQELQYRFTATDASAAANQTVLPASGQFTVPIEVIRSPVSSFTLDFDGDPDADVIFDGFSIRQPNGFDSPNLGTPSSLHG